MALIEVAEKSEVKLGLMAQLNIIFDRANSLHSSLDEFGKFVDNYIVPPEPIDQKELKAKSPWGGSTALGLALDIEALINNAIYRIASMQNKLEL